MKLLVIGVNHKTAPISLREQLAFSDEQKNQALQQLSQFTSGAVIVSTCNRTEIYALATEEESTELYSTDSLTNSITYLKRWLSTNKQVPLSELEQHLYTHQSSQAVSHWIRVAAGLDSMILGEPQILGQIKNSVQTSMKCDSVSTQLNWIIDQVFSATKRVRHETQVGSQAVTLGFATAKLATQIFEEITSCHLLIVASGEMNRLVAKHITGLGIGNITICNRSKENAEKLASELKEINPLINVQVKALSSLEESLELADIVCSCSGSMHPLITFQMMKKIIKKRRYRSMLMVDLAVPRDIEAKITKLDEVYLYSIDDLQHVIAGNIEKRKQAAVDAELLISQLVVDINKDFRVRNVGADIQAFRQVSQQRAETILADILQQLPKRVITKQVLLDKESPNQPLHINNKHSLNNHESDANFYGKLDVSNNIDHDHEVELLMVELTRRLTQTLTHAPSKLMRKVAREGEDEALEAVVSTLMEAYRE